ncbi:MULTISPECIES: OmpA family protein [unclassified Acinetobacter]|uniref:OmpA family protein n=1 Tax=unclassified Acinetobacter TaxID=196816 RepID=UPI0015D17D5E|nr:MULTISPECIES: OmpA family protein [unclassified Acinetobacter]
MLKNAFKVLFILAFTTTMTACMSLGNLSYKQARMLKKEGFVLTNDGWTLALPERLLFGFDDYQIQPHQQGKLNTLATQLIKYDLNKIKFIGHTDNVGQANYNQQLSEKRAQSVANVFLKQGYNSSNIQIIGRGAEQPMVSNDTETNRAINRRVNVTIIP